MLLNFYLSDIIIKFNYALAENPVFDIVFVQNQGAAFNIFDGYKIFLITFSCLALLALLFYVIKHIAETTVLSLFFTSMLLSGIFNNMCERIMFGFVRDYIKLNFVDFPVFNISDIFINIGVFGIIFIIIKNHYFKK